MPDEVTSIKEFINEVQALNASRGHFQIESVKENPNLTIVISVYDGIKPSHQVLDELWNWAEENGLKEVMNKIKQFEEMS